MKSLKILLCSLAVIFSGFVFVACGKSEPKNFDVSKIVIGIDELVYNGEAQAIGVSYPNVKTNVMYALENDKNNFKSVEDLGLVDAGTYNIYYRLSASGYNSYTSDEVLELTITPKTLNIRPDKINMYEKKANLAGAQIYPGYVMYGACEDLNVTFELVDFDIATAKYGDVYTVSASVSSPNYNVVCEGENNQKATLTITDSIELQDSLGNVVDGYGNFQEALDNAEDGYVLVLNEDVEVDALVNVNKSVTIDGKGLYTVKAGQDFVGATEENNRITNSLFHISNDAANADVELTLKDVTLDGNQVARGVSAFKGKVVIDGATITNGKKTDNRRSGGVFISNNASFEMKDGSITGNDANDATYTKYCADLWIGANATGTLYAIEDGEVGSVFINSNSYSAVNAGMFELKGGNIETVYVEYDSGFGGVFKYTDGLVKEMLIALNNQNGNFYGAFATIKAEKDTTYYGGQILYGTEQTNFVEQTFVNNIDEFLVEGNTYIFENCTFSVAVNTTKKVGLIFNNCTFNASSVGSYGDRCIYVTSVTNLIVNNSVFNGEVSKGIASAAYTIEVNQYSADCGKIVVTNNIFNTTSIDVQAAVSVKARLGETDTPDASVETWATTATRGTIESVLIGGNDFTDENNNIYVGTTAKGSSTAANTTTGDFEVVVSDNLDELIVYTRYQDSKGDEGSESKVEVELKGEFYQD